VQCSNFDFKNLMFIPVPNISSIVRRTLDILPHCKIDITDDPDAIYIIGAIDRKVKIDILFINLKINFFF